ncbi:MAG: LysM peptidoglycan-binding domain-containing protein [Xanthomonadaceae bacterium]|nr:LysM peptidoglycan-binding domain-containing protein [Xanthomonadaceae bacterium]MDE1962590.1 LysM peptidoglycan-binding domain-containing protein [Xanthomonadaceae bacterium]
MPPIPAVTPASSARLRRARLPWWALLLALGGCAQIQGLMHPSPKPVAAPAAPPPAAAPTPAPPAVELHPLAWIVNEQLQRGHYADGERYLRRYLQAHPGDRAAEALLRQLTDDPRQRLGPPAQVHVVQAGESFSTLARRYLGDASQFLILARYNGSDDPSRLWAGQKVKLPRAHAGATVHAAAQPAVTPADPAGRSQALQRESLALLRAGRESQAVAVLDRALRVDPGLASDRDGAEALRQALVSACHERAIVLYRDQQLAPAIALWDRVLTIRPDYEPAIAYRARALELQRRLKQL